MLLRIRTIFLVGSYLRASSYQVWKLMPKPTAVKITVKLYKSLSERPPFKWIGSPSSNYKEK